MLRTYFQGLQVPYHRMPTQTRNFHFSHSLSQNTFLSKRNLCRPVHMSKSFSYLFSRGRMLPVKSPTGRPGTLVCVYASTGHNSAVLSLCVSENTMFSGSKGQSTPHHTDINAFHSSMLYIVVKYLV